MQSAFHGDVWHPSEGTREAALRGGSLSPTCPPPLQAPREQQSSKQGPWFRQPTVEDLEAHRVVVTTLSSSKMLLDTGVKRGFFTHIFIDEAAQAMETQCILPLALADKTTRIVLAGDYMQLNPEVFSVFTRERRLHVSLLERLHDAFPRTAASARGGSDERWPHPCQVVLGDNYRSHEALVRFASESFYQGRLRALGCPGPHHVLHPLSFFAVRGSDLPRDGSTSYLNTKEVRGRGGGAAERGGESSAAGGRMQRKKDRSWSTQEQHCVFFHCGQR